MQQEAAAFEESHTHGIAQIGPVSRLVYFDLGGVFDLVDLGTYYTLLDLIARGKLPNAKALTPMDIGYPERGVPIDVAAAHDGQSSVIYVQHWIRVTVVVRTHAGRELRLTQLVIGAVQRATPLLILGKRTCAICGYKSIEQQDRDMSDNDGDHQPGPKKGNPKENGGSSQSATQTGGHTTLEVPFTMAACEPRIKITVITDEEYQRASHQYINLAISEPMQRPVHGVSTATDDAGERDADQCDGQTGGDSKDKQEREHRYQHQWHNKHNERGSYRDTDRPNRQWQSWPREAGHVIELPSPTLESVGKTMCGDADEDDDGATAEEADDEEGPGVADSICLQIPVLEEDALQLEYPQYASVACGLARVRTTDARGNDMNTPDPAAVLPDGYIYAGARAHTHMDGSEFIVTDRLQ